MPTPAHRTVRKRGLLRHRSRPPQRRAAYGRFRAQDRSIAMLLAVAYSISVNKLSKPPSVVRLGADNRLVAG
jgi:hypothetical protein